MSKSWLWQFHSLIFHKCGSSTKRFIDQTKFGFWERRKTDIPSLTFLWDEEKGKEGIQYFVWSVIKTNDIFYSSTQLQDTRGRIGLSNVSLSATYATPAVVSTLKTFFVSIRLNWV